MIPLYKLLISTIIKTKILFYILFKKHLYMQHGFKVFFNFIFYLNSGLEQVLTTTYNQWTELFIEGIFL